MASTDCDKIETTETDTVAASSLTVPSTEDVEKAPVDDTGPITPPPFSIYSRWEKRLMILGAALSATFSPLTGQIYLPALTVLADEFNVIDAEINLTITTYMIFQGITPMFIGGFADSAGWRPAYLICFVIYIAANVGLAMSQSYTSLLVVRCIQSAGSATTIALCQVIVTDIATSAERGQYMGIMLLPIAIGPSLGPVLGGALSQYLGWRWIFWVLAILASVDLVAMLLFFPETCRRIVGDGSVKAHLIYRTSWKMLADRRPKDENTSDTVSPTSKSAATLKGAFSLRPLLASITLICTNLELFVMLMYNAIVFAGPYAVRAALPSQFHALFELTDLQIGFLYLPMTAGSIVAAFFSGRSLNWNFCRHAKKQGLQPVDKSRQLCLKGFPIEKARLQAAGPFLLLSAAVMITWGWSVEYSGGLAAPCVLMFLLWVGNTGVTNACNALVADICPTQAGAASAAGNLTRCLLGAAASAVIVPMIGVLSSGWAYTLMGGLSVLFAPLLLLLMIKGPSWREAFEKKMEDKRALDS
ncbi:major facilitator superfamily domain-containing protein [Podospora australis]|uniref:Major facilitator superfamily domain-containing protein n=1 Tax=Podospora australis TaxID=1536484 RepID=A0AAN7AGC8_9PEZI|nr:major facilitator superfamily domain-containing protein [Podospora australis]